MSRVYQLSGLHTIPYNVLVGDILKINFTHLIFFSGLSSTPYLYDKNLQPHIPPATSLLQPSRFITYHHAASHLSARCDLKISLSLKRSSPTYCRTLCSYIIVFSHDTLRSGNRYAHQIDLLTPKSSDMSPPRAVPLIRYL